MKFVIDKGLVENPFKNSRQKFETTTEENNFLNKGIINEELEFDFISTDVQVGEISHVIQVKLDGYETEQDFVDAASSVDGSSFDANNTNFIKPVNFFDITSLELTGESPTYRVDSSVNYYKQDIDDSFMNGAGLPNIYRETIERTKVTKKIVEANFSSGEVIEENEPTVIFDNQFKLSTANSNKGAFPCYSEVVVTKKDINIFTKILSKLDLFSFFMNDVSQRMSRDVNFSVNTGGGLDDSFKSNLLRYLIANISSDNLEIETVVSNRTERSKSKINFLDKLEALGDLQKESVANSNFKTMVQNKSVPNETVFYKIEKFAGDQASSLIKTYLVPSESDVMTFIDTEVVYNSTYSYKVTAFVIIYGTNYTYNYLDSDYINSKAKYRVTSVPSPIMVEMELFTSNTTPATTPPLSPSVKFVNQSNSDNSIKMVFNLRKGTERQHFIKILPTDMNFVFKKDVGYDKVKFAYNKEPIRVQVMRLENKPNSVFDFENGNLRTFSNTTLTSNREMLIRDDFIFPNKKYYYCFRTVSLSGMVSNPSPVYEIELIKSADETRINSNIIEVDKDKPHVPTISLRKMLQIRPALHQSVIHKASIDDDLEGSILGEVVDIDSPLKEYSVGTADYPIWGRKIKIRIKSKTSGKMIDLNVNFDLIKDEKNEDL